MFSCYLPLPATAIIQPIVQLHNCNSDNVCVYNDHHKGALAKSLDRSAWFMFPHVCSYNSENWLIYKDCTLYKVRKLAGQVSTDEFYTTSIGEKLLSTPAFCTLTHSLNSTAVGTILPILLLHNRNLDNVLIKWSS